MQAADAAANHFCQTLHIGKGIAPVNVPVCRTFGILLRRCFQIFQNTLSHHHLLRLFCNYQIFHRINDVIGGVDHQLGLACLIMIYSKLHV